MTVAEGMQELKRISKLIRTRCNQISRYSSKKKGMPDEVANQKKYVDEQWQSARDLLARYSKIKLAIQSSNLIKGFTFEDRFYTIAEAILYKQYLASQLNMLLDSFNDYTAKSQLSKFTDAIRVLSRNANATNNNAQQVLNEASLVPELYYNPVEIQREREKLTDFLSKVNVLIDKSNHEAQIEI